MKNSDHVPTLFFIIEFETAIFRHDNRTKKSWDGPFLPIRFTYILPTFSTVSRSFYARKLLAMHINSH